MKYANDSERQRVLQQALNATTLLELDAAACALNTWVAAHPDDIGIQDAYEQMALMEIAARQTSAQKVYMPEPLRRSGAETVALSETDGVIGAWADRQDIGDSSTYARHLRENA